MKQNLWEDRLIRFSNDSKIFRLQMFTLLSSIMYQVLFFYCSQFGLNSEGPRGSSSVLHILSADVRTYGYHMDADQVQGQQ